MLHNCYSKLLNFFWTTSAAGQNNQESFHECSAAATSSPNYWWCLHPLISFMNHDEINPFLARTQSTSCIHPTLGLWGDFCIRFQDSCVMPMLHFVPSHIPLARLSENLIPRCSTNLYHFIDSLKLTRKKAFLICRNQTAALPSW